MTTTHSLCTGFTRVADGGMSQSRVALNTVCCPWRHPASWTVDAPPPLHASPESCRQGPKRFSAETAAPGADARLRSNRRAASPHPTGLKHAARTGGTPPLGPPPHPFTTAPSEPVLPVELSAPTSSIARASSARRQIHSHRRVAQSALTRADDPAISATAAPRPSSARPSAHPAIPVYPLSTVCLWSIESSRRRPLPLLRPCHSGCLPLPVQRPQTAPNRCPRASLLRQDEL